MFVYSVWKNDRVKIKNGGENFMKYCTSCGAEIMDEAVVCPKCGVAVANMNSAPILQLKTNRGLLKFILLSIITFGIYGIVVMSQIGEDINTIAGKYDGKKTMHYCLVFFLFSWLTLGIVPLVWIHKLSARIGNELNRRGIGNSFGAGTFWGWCILGSLIVIGPFVYYHKLFKSMNLLSADYNVRG